MSLLSLQVLLTPSSVATGLRNWGRRKCWVINIALVTFTLYPKRQLGDNTKTSVQKETLKYIFLNLFNKRQRYGDQVKYTLNGAPDKSNSTKFKRQNLFLQIENVGDNLVDDKGSSLLNCTILTLRSFVCVCVCVCVAYQCSSRGGELELEVRDDGRINIAGQTVTILQGTITL